MREQKDRTHRQKVFSGGAVEDDPEERKDDPRDAPSSKGEQRVQGKECEPKKRDGETAKKDLPIKGGKVLSFASLETKTSRWKARGGRKNQKKGKEEKGAREKNCLSGKGLEQQDSSFC